MFCTVHCVCFYVVGADEATISSMDTFQSPVGVLHAVRPTSAGKKKAKQLHFEEQVDKAIMHSQRELAVAPSAQVEIMREQLQVANKKVEIMESQQQAERDQAEMAIMCTSTEGLSDFGKQYLLLKQKQVLDRMKNRIGLTE
ncbi:hypothetical protein PF004_g31141 [Phytophthora fragariae]|uniref:No apical meristem-associated C-terminal domain-containing protein n=1 Tax=Phytophthora fragariae TaxID=53985 RepID=A0A6G0M9Y8_9STRA|nr:hypothetical protein PF004_g31141 [Phytophthora fragariae]